MSQFYVDEAVTVLHGDALDVLRDIPDASIDAVVTDPPYGLEFMGRDWDAPWRQAGINRDAGFGGGGVSATRNAPSFTSSTNPNCQTCGGKQRGRRDGTAKVRVCVCDRPQFPNTRAVEMQAFGDWCLAWAAECLRVLRPGGHLAAFGGSRTWHRLAVAVEDAGFEIRDSIAWLYGNGFPKSRDVTGAMDRFLAQRPTSPEARPDAVSPRVYELTAFLREARDAAGWTNKQLDELFGTNGMAGHWTSRATQPVVPSPAQWARLKEALGFDDSMDDVARALHPRDSRPSADRDGRPFLAALRKTGTYEHAGAFGTALKPAFEPIVVARKPLAGGSVAANVLDHGTGALNIAGARVGDGGGHRTTGIRSGNPAPVATYGAGRNGMQSAPVAGLGRWPANVALDDQAAADLDAQSAAATSRYFPTFRYEAKAPTSERPTVDGVAHPTVKPLALMRWLVRLLTPPGGVVLDPFAGSGTTAEACAIENLRCVAIEREPAYLPLILARLTKPIAATLDLGDLS